MAFVNNGGSLKDTLAKAKIHGEMVQNSHYCCAGCGERLGFQIYPHYEAYRIARLIYSEVLRRSLATSGLLHLYEASKTQIGPYAESAVTQPLLAHDTFEIAPLRRAQELRDSLPPENGGGEDQFLVEIAMSIGWGIVGNLATDLLKWGFKKVFGRKNIKKQLEAITPAIKNEVESYNKHDPRYEFTEKELLRIRKLSKKKLKSIIRDTKKRTKKDKK
jgi:hypothetical protein